MTQTLKEIRTNLYNKGKWKEAEEELLKTMESMNKQSGEYYSALVLIGWIFWKEGKKIQAVQIWASVLCLDFISENDRLSAMCGLAIFNSESKNENGAKKALEYVEKILENPSDKSSDAAIRFNSVGIALAKIGQFEQAEQLLFQAMAINELLEESGGQTERKEAKLQRAKNGYNASYLVWVPKMDYESALEELHNEVVPRYVEAEAETDLAAAYHRISEIYLLLKDQKETNLTDAYNFELMSADIWKRHEADDPKRFIQAQENLSKIETLMTEQKNRQK